MTSKTKKNVQIIISSPYFCYKNNSFMIMLK